MGTTWGEGTKPLPHRSASVMRVGRFMRFFDSIEGHLKRAEKEDVKDALEVAAARRSNQWKWSKDRNMMMSSVIPNSWAFNPKFRFGLETLDEHEKAAFLEAYRRTFSKMSV